MAALIRMYCGWIVWIMRCWCLNFKFFPRIQSSVKTNASQCVCVYTCTRCTLYAVHTHSFWVVIVIRSLLYLWLEHIHATWFDGSNKKAIKTCDNLVSSLRMNFFVWQCLSRLLDDVRQTWIVSNIFFRILARAGAHVSTARQYFGEAKVVFFNLARHVP